MLQLKIEPDQDAISPREDMDNFTTMYCSHRNYRLGDVQIKSEEELWRAKQNADWFLPLFLLDHSGITMNTTGFNDPWDSGQVGIITTTKEQLHKLGHDSPKEEDAIALMRQEVEVYDQYLRGDVWGYTITDTATGEVVDSLWGMYGHDYCEKEANEALERLTKRREHMMPYQGTVEILFPAFDPTTAKENFELLMNGLKERDAILDWQYAEPREPDPDRVLGYPIMVRYGSYGDSDAED